MHADTWHERKKFVIKRYADIVRVTFNWKIYTEKN